MNRCFVNLDRRRGRRKEIASRLVAAERRRKFFPPNFVGHDLVNDQRRNVFVLVVATLGVTLFQADAFPNVVCCRVVLEDTQPTAGEVWTVGNVALEQRPVFDLVIFQHVCPQRVSANETRGTACFAAWKTSKPILEAAPNKFIVGASNVLVVVLLLRR